MVNDFTKEELQIILKMHDNLTVGTHIEGMGHVTMKISSMIDNYCDHPEAYRMMYGATILDYCDKCKHIFKFIEG
jgi:hypothetical protein